MFSAKRTGIFIGICTCLLAFPSASEDLSWKAIAGQQYDIRVSIVESVAGLKTVTAKPAVVRNETLPQETVAENLSSRPYLKNVMYFPKNEIKPGDEWKGTVEVAYDLTAFGLLKELPVKAPARYTYTGITTIDGIDYSVITAEWHPLHILSSANAKRTGVLKLSGLSTMTIIWDAREGRPKETRLTEEIQYRFGDDSALVLRRETREEYKASAQNTPILEGAL
jgi:hypothetical protein